MNFENKISVIVCTYNQESTIGRTLDSILSQRCHLPFEIIIGEDCSSDATRAVCEEYAQRYPDIIRLLANEKNKGLIDNYFDCLLAARGKYLADCAGDDEWCDPEKLEKQLTILEQHPEVVLVHTDYECRNAESEERFAPIPIWYPEGLCRGEEMLWHIMEQGRRPAVHLCTVLWRNEVFRRMYEATPHLLRNHQYLMEDVPICALASQEGDFYYLTDVTLTYETGKESEGHKEEDSRQFRFIYSLLIILRDMATHAGIHGDPRMKQIYEQRLWALSMHAFRAYDREERNQAIEMANALIGKKNFRLKAFSIVTAHLWSWKLALLLRRLFVSLKKLC